MEENSSLYVRRTGQQWYQSVQMHLLLGCPRHQSNACRTRKLVARALSQSRVSTVRDIGLFNKVVQGHRRLKLHSHSRNYPETRSSSTRRCASSVSCDLRRIPCCGMIETFLFNVVDSQNWKTWFRRLDSLLSSQTLYEVNKLLRSSPTVFRSSGAIGKVESQYKFPVTASARTIFSKRRPRCS